MKIIMAGGTGFLGRRLASDLVEAGHQVVILTRGTKGGRPTGTPPAATLATWTPNGDAGPWVEACAGADAFINLAGESIAGRRWSASQKQRILDSPLKATRSLVAAVDALTRPPAVFLSASAVGYYGSRGDDVLTERAVPGSDFLANVCVAWEIEAARAAGGATRVVLLRTGIVLDRSEGALPKMLPPFKLFAGGPLGTGRQYMPWIHEEDWRRLARWCLDRPGAAGPYNATGPNPVTNAEFARELGRALHRPSWLRAPAFALRLAVGEMAGPLLLSSQRAVPANALEHGFAFRHAELPAALKSFF